MAKAYATNDVEEVHREADILSTLDIIQKHLNGAHAFCDSIHGPCPRSGRQEGEKGSDDRLSLVEKGLRSIELDMRELIPRLREILSRLGQTE